MSRKIKNPSKIPTNTKKVGGLGRMIMALKISLTASFCSSPRSVVHWARHQVKIAWRGKGFFICLISCFFLLLNLPFPMNNFSEATSGFMWCSWVPLWINNLSHSSVEFEMCFKQSCFWRTSKVEELQNLWSWWPSLNLAFSS